MINFLAGILANEIVAGTIIGLHLAVSIFVTLERTGS